MQLKDCLGIICSSLFYFPLWASELPPPFTSYETTSTSESGVNGTIYEWDVNVDGVLGDLYAGRILLSSLSSSITLKFDGTPGTLKFKCTNYTGGSRRYAWLNDGQFINDWYSELNGNSYMENSLSCRFDDAGEHQLVLSLSMQKNASKYYVQGPRLKVYDIEWQPDYVDVDVDGKAVRVDGEWVRQNVSSNALHDCKYDYGDILNRVGDNGYTILDSYIAGLTPTNSNSRLLADIQMVNNATVITWEPNLDTRVYTIYGKTNLTDRAWHSPTNEASRFFKVGVEMR